MTMPMVYAIKIFKDSEINIEDPRHPDFLANQEKMISFYYTTFRFPDQGIEILNNGEVIIL